MKKMWALLRSNQRSEERPASGGRHLGHPKEGRECPSLGAGEFSKGFQEAVTTELSLEGEAEDTDG